MNYTDVGTSLGTKKVAVLVGFNKFTILGTSRSLMY